jgi:branched-chain amino acid transport system ATP-binding protein
VQALLELESVTAGYGAVKAVKQVSLRVGAKEVVVLLGPNGAGKTSTLRAASGIIRLDGGAISFRGTDISRAKAETIARLGLSHVPENRGIFRTLSVEENLLVGKRGARVTKANPLAARVFDLFPWLWERRDQRAGTLSGGEQQMLAVGRALMGEPALIMLDEPSTGLSPVMVERVYEALSQVNADGTPLLVVEQNAELALGWSDRAYVMAKGEIVTEGKSAELANSRLVEEAYFGVVEAPAT